MMQSYYVNHSKFSDPKQYAYLYDTFSTDIATLTQEVQYLFLHYADLDLFSTAATEEKYAELNLRYINPILQKLITYNDAPLNQYRTFNQRVMGVCRDTSLLICSVLRSRGIPARLRAGFVNYFIPGLFLDGFCIEYFDDHSQRWISIDTRTMQQHIDHYHLRIDFNLMDVPDTKFISAAQAWAMCRFKNADPVRFGSRQHRGLFTVRNRLMQDLALLNKQETLIWDLWGPMLTASVVDYDLFDSLANLLSTDSNNSKKMTEFYQSHSLLSIPDKILMDSPFSTAQWVTLC